MYEFLCMCMGAYECTLHDSQFDRIGNTMIYRLNPPMAAATYPLSCTLAKTIIPNTTTTAVANTNG